MAEAALSGAGIIADYPPALHHALQQGLVVPVLADYALPSKRCIGCMPHSASKKRPYACWWMRYAQPSLCNTHGNLASAFKIMSYAYL